VEIAPVPGERRRILPQPQHRADPRRTEPTRAEPQRSGGANPFPAPIGSPPTVRPSTPQSVRPIF
jgi:hypothetical protein